MSAYINELRNYFKPGRIVYVSYWNTYDKVISFNVHNTPEEHWSSWSVTVIECNRDGSAIPGKEPRSHCTQPTKREMETNI